SYTYDENNRIKTVSFDAVLQRSYTYTASGQVATVQDSRGTTSYTYDLRDRLTKVEQPDHSAIEYTYDQVGNRVSVKTRFGTTLYGYDAANRLVMVTAPDNGVTQYTYDAIGNLVRTDYSSGVTETRTYDQMGHLLTLTQFTTLGALASYAYTYDTLGQQTDVVESGGRSVHYTYDRLGRLTRESVTDPAASNFTIDYTYDAVGNRLTRNHSLEGLTAYVYDANDRLLTETTGAVVTSYTYDADGNLLSRSGAGNAVTAQWNALDQLVSADVTDSAGTHHYSYEYDRSGNRVSEKVDGQETRFLIDELQPNSQVLAEYSPSGSSATSYVYGLNRIAQQNNGQSSLYLPDGLGSTRLLTDPSGMILNRYVYDSFGNTIGSSGSTSNRFRFTGEQVDGALGGYYLRARIYNPATGRFVSQDPAPPQFGLSQSINRYVYAFNQPVTRTDPSGLFSDLVSTLKTVALQSALDFGRGVSLGATALGTLQGVGVAAYYFSHDHATLHASGFVQGFSLSTDDLLGRVSLGVGLDQVIPMNKNILRQAPLYPTAIGFGLGVNFTPVIKVPSRLLAAFREGEPGVIGVELHIGLMFKFESPDDAGGAQSSVNLSFQGLPTESIGETLYVSLPAKTYGSLVNYSLIPVQYARFRAFPTPVRLSVPSSGLSSQFSYGVYIGDWPSFTGAGGVLAAGAFQAIQAVHELFS
ncbi:MAG: RHS repeat domain-containing protein, partial [Aureliella sp.]